MERKPTIIGVADTTRYLVGATDADDNFTALPLLRDVVVCGSICAAKELLRKNKIYTADLKLQSPYDEMCGLPVSSVTTQTVRI